MHAHLRVNRDSVGLLLTDREKVLRAVIVMRWLGLD